MKRIEAGEGGEKLEEELKIIIRLNEKLGEEYGKLEKEKRS